ncbi:MAG: hypothetical protein MUF09_12285 [Candidatus Nanopelagicales bacterium]|jgi:hypothetical protein|nr:hypothetical protein [Candidatus Nanopelagicales bacterium]
MSGGRSRFATASAAVALALLGFGLVGCGGGDGDATIVTDDGTVKVDVDPDGDEGTVKIESSEGSMTITGDGGGELPEGWPSDVVVPEGGTVTSAVALSGEEQGWTASLTYPDMSTKDLAAEVRSNLESAGFTLEGEFTSGEGAMGTWSGNGYAVTSMVGQEDDGATLLITIAKES